MLAENVKVEEIGSEAEARGIIRNILSEPGNYYQDCDDCDVTLVKDSTVSVVLAITARIRELDKQ